MTLPEPTEAQNDQAFRQYMEGSTNEQVTFLLTRTALDAVHEALERGRDVSQPKHRPLLKARID
jgi:hypothetical protein